MDAVISPSGNKEWSIYEKGTAVKFGTVQQTDARFLVLAGKDNPLTGVSLGPYKSKDDAMAAIGAKVGGTCSVGI